MSAQTAVRGGSAPPAPGQLPGRVRNVVLVGPAGAGKTTLVESLLAATGTIARAGSVVSGTTVCDHDETEVRQQRSIALAVAPFVHDGVTVTLLDTPGYADFVGELRAGLRAADAALFVMSATDAGADGRVDPTTALLWAECAEVAMPRAIVLTRLDHPRADVGAAVAACRQTFGEGVAPLYLPIGSGPATGLVGLLSGTAWDYSGGTRAERPAGDVPGYDEARATLIEGIIAESEDETLMERYLGGETLDPAMLVADLETAVLRGSFFPVLLTAQPGGFGAAELLEVLTSGFPSPVEHPLPSVTRPDGSAYDRPLTADPDGPLVAEVVRTTTDPYVGRISLVRVFSGTLRPDLPVHVSGHGRGDVGHPDHDVDERIGTLAIPLGRVLTPVGACAAGGVCAVGKLAHAETGDTLSGRDEPLLVEAWRMPEPLLPVAVRAASKADEDKLSTALARLVAEDPTVRLEQNPETGQLVLWCMGEAHADVLTDRLAGRYGVVVDRVDLRVPLRETFDGPANGTGRHVKQSGGHGQYAVCRIEVEPVPGGTGLEFVDRVVGGAVPRQFIPSVEKGVRAQMERGVRAGYPVVGIRVCLVDGKAHSVDSSDMAFQVAGALALRDAAQNGSVALLEPVLHVGVLVADEHVGAVLGDLATRRGRVVGTEPVGGGGRTHVVAEVPETEMVRYAVELRSVAHGTGTFSRRFLRYEPVPAHLAAGLVG